MSFETNKSDAGSRKSLFFFSVQIHPDLFYALVAFRVSFIQKCFIVFYLDPTTFVEAVVSVSMCVCVQVVLREASPSAAGGVQTSV